MAMFSSFLLLPHPPPSSFLLSPPLRRYTVFLNIRNTIALELYHGSNPSSFLFSQTLLTLTKALPLAGSTGAIMFRPAALPQESAQDQLRTKPQVFNRLRFLSAAFLIITPRSRAPLLVIIIIITMIIISQLLLFFLRLFPLSRSSSSTILSLSQHLTLSLLLPPLTSCPSLLLLLQSLSSSSSI
eukprot:1634479-Rhodomonas_salina.3